MFFAPRLTDSNADQDLFTTVAHDALVLATKSNGTTQRPSAYMHESNFLDAAGPVFLSTTIRRLVLARFRIEKTMILCSFPALNPSKINGLTLASSSIPGLPLCRMLTECHATLYLLTPHEAFHPFAKACSPARHVGLSQRERVDHRCTERSRAGSDHPAIR